MAAWDACADPSMRLEDFLGQPCWIGGDLASRDDFGAVAIVFLRDALLYGFVHLYLPADVVAARARAVPEYRRWARTPGLLTLTEGNMLDFAVVEADVRELCRLFAVKAISFDQFGSFQLVGNLFNSGLPAYVTPKNAKTCTAGTRELEARVMANRFRHDGNSCLRWMAANAVVTRRIDDSLLVKKSTADSPDKIDALDALISAISAMLLQPVAPERRFQMLILGGRP